MAEAGFTLVDARGRKYLTAEERTRFLAAAEVRRRELLSWTERGYRERCLGGAPMPKNWTEL